MHVAVDAHNLLVDRRGIGVYLRAVLSRMATRRDVRITLLVKDIVPWRLRGALAEELFGERADERGKRLGIANRVPSDATVVWHPWNGTFFESPVPSVATVHDVTPFAFPAPDADVRRREQAPFLVSAEAARILTDSEFSRSEIVRYLGVDESRISVAPLAADSRFFPAEGEPQPGSDPIDVRLRGPFVLYVGANDPRKNLVTLAAAHAAAFPDGRVALACVTRHAPAGAVELRDVSFEKLRALYRQATVFAMPSLYEGFGIPPLEAMRCGTPVIASRAASLPEVCGDAALYVDEPTNVEAWRVALLRLVPASPNADRETEALRQGLRERGVRQAEKFTWERTEAATFSVLQAVGHRS